jgi:hypothetical protein
VTSQESDVEVLLRELIPILKDHQFSVKRLAYKRPGKYCPPEEAVLLECKRAGHKTTWCAVERYGNGCVGKAYNTKTCPGSTDTKGYMMVPMDPDDATDACDAIAHEADRQSV